MPPPVCWRIPPLVQPSKAALCNAQDPSSHHLLDFACGEAVAVPSASMGGTAAGPWPTGRWWGHPPRYAART